MKRVQQSQSKLETRLQFPKWAHIASSVGDELARLRSRFMPRDPSVAHVARADTEKIVLVEEEIWAIDEPVAPDTATGTAELAEDDSIYTKFSVVINEKPTMFRYVAGDASGTPLALATGYCKDPGNGLGLISTVGGWDDCIATLTIELDKFMNSAPEPTAPAVSEVPEVSDEPGVALSAEGVRQLPLVVNGVTYVFEYHVDLDLTFTAQRLAEEFCAAKGVGIGLFLQWDAPEVVREKCTAPLTRAIRVELVIAKNGINV